MRLAASTEFVRIMSEMVRRADAGLVRSAARNAAYSVQAERVRRLDDARTIRDLQRIPLAQTAGGTASQA